MLKALTSLGLSEMDANVYTFLAINGPQKTANIAEELRLQQQPLYQTLENLQSKGVVNSTREHSTLFYALPFDRALELLIDAYLKDALSLEQDKNELLSKWRALIIGTKGQLTNTKNH